MDHQPKQYDPDPDPDNAPCYRKVFWYVFDSVRYDVLQAKRILIQWTNGGCRSETVFASTQPKRLVCALYAVWCCKSS